MVLRQCFKIDMVDGCYIDWSLKLDRRDFDHTSLKALCLKEGAHGITDSVFVMIISLVGDSFERVGGGLVSCHHGLYSQDGVKFLGDYAIKDRYGEQWTKHLVRTYDTFRIG